WIDPKCWRKANPGLGTIKNEKTLSAKVEKAKANPLLVKNLVCKSLILGRPVLRPGCLLKLLIIQPYLTWQN
ncbi:MAG: hypothetical protein PHP51_07050, partial [Desulfotomaculaceae bacterium]|nr:hypothetical protein [Desulfotomaculaceae bacterium]